MAWHPVQNTKTGRVYQDDQNPAKHAVDSVVGTVLHYESEIDSGNHDTPVDMTPSRVNNAALDGWRVTQAGWHYALGIPGSGALAGQDGVVGFGGRQGQRWLQFRLQRMGYLHWPTRSWQDIGGAPTYARNRLTQTTNQLTLPTDGDTINVSMEVNWDRIWAVPGGGQADLRWRVDGGRLKEEIVLNQVGREWIATNRPPTTPLTETWFCWAFKLDVSDIPRWERFGQEQDPDGDFEFDDMELRDSLGRLLAFLPIDYVYLWDETQEDPLVAKEPLKKRLYFDGTDHWLVVGIQTDVLNGMPNGDLVFDPTIDPVVGTANDDCRENTVGGVTSGSNARLNSSSPYMGWRWQITGPASGDTVDVCYFRVYGDHPALTDWDGTSDFCAEDNHSAWNLGASSFDLSSGRTKTGNSVTTDLTLSTSGYVNSPSIVTPAQAVIDRGGWSSGNYMGIIHDWRDDGVSANAQFKTYDEAPSQAPILHMEYTASGGGTTYNDSVTEGLSIGDAETAILTAAAAFSEGLEAGDQWASRLLAAAGITEGTELGAEFVTNLLAAASISEGAALGDEFSAAISASEGVSEGVSLGDSFTADVLTGVVQSAISEGSRCGEVFAAAVQSLVYLSEGVALGDQVSAALTALAQLSEGLEVGDSFSDQITSQLSVSEGTIYSDSFTARRIAVVSLNEGFTIGDTWTAQVRAQASLLESVIFGDTFRVPADADAGLVCASITLMAAITAASATTQPAVDGTPNLSPALDGTITTNEENC